MSSELKQLAISAGIKVLENDGLENLPDISSGANLKAVNSREADIHKSVSDDLDKAAVFTFSEDILCKCTDECMEELEKLFADRYTDKDKEYTSTLSSTSHPPPCIPNWKSYNRNFDRSRDRHGGRGNWNRNQGQWGRDDRRGQRDYGQRSQGYDHRRDYYSDNYRNQYSDSRNHHQRNRDWSPSKRN